jgi:putative ABC transport system substrate-binding protein
MWLRRLLVVLIVVALSGAADAQQAKKVPRIGFLSLVSEADPARLAFQEGLRQLGWVEGQNITIEYRYAEGVNEPVPNLAAELVQLKVDVIVSTGTPATRAAKNATKQFPSS